MKYKHEWQSKKQAESEIEEAKRILLRHATDNKLKKYKVPGFVSVSYSGLKTKVYVDEGVL